MKKGMELPINTLVVFIIALVVLIAFIALFMNVQGQGGSTVSIETAKNSGCQRYVSMNYCNTPTTSGSSISIQSVQCSDTAKTIANDLETLAAKCYGITATTTNSAASQLCCL
ncbi:MAG: hypothetical protein KJ697_04295 [Nanoarchaeota archaeon]|nr:hypothetical protein [Nanoarchaeota archaeon]MBU4124284.1 hypothetical protein [Nanoarchaeota archaeon]